MPSPVSRSQVSAAVASLNDKLAALGWERRYHFLPGNHVNGVNHKIETLMPGLTQPLSVFPIGNTYSKAHKYVEAMDVVLRDALAERERLRSLAISRSR